MGKLFHILGSQCVYGMSHVMEWVCKEGHGWGFAGNFFRARSYVVGCSLFSSFCTPFLWNSCCHSSVITERKRSIKVLPFGQSKLFLSYLCCVAVCQASHTCLSQASLSSDAAGCPWWEVGPGWQGIGMLRGSGLNFSVTGIKVTGICDTRNKGIWAHSLRCWLWVR